MTENDILDRLIFSIIMVLKKNIYGNFFNFKCTFYPKNYVRNSFIHVREYLIRLFVSSQ
jgi:hypothetical protein